MMERHGQSAIYYAHAGAGEIHLRPVLNLKTKEGLSFKHRNRSGYFGKKYRGSLSGSTATELYEASFYLL
jgi:hypothetical protein